MAGYAKKKITESDLMSMYRYMLLTREFEYTLLQIFKQKGLPEVLHLCIGEEAIGVGACYAMQKNDVIVPALRSRAIFLTRGVSPAELMAGVMGKEGGPSKGKFTAHHMGDLEKGIYAASLCIGSQLPLAVGAGLHFNYNNLHQVALVTFGDGATSRGDFHESLNLAAAFKLPVLFICENNQYAIDTPASLTVSVDKIAVRAQAYNIPGITIDGNNILEVYDTVSEAMDRARNGEGPTLIECMTYRMRPHTEYLVEDRPKEELSYWENQCPIKRFRQYLMGNNVLDAEKERVLISEIKEELKQAVIFAEQSPFPDLDDIHNDVFTDVYEN
jgi:TPP-dependent pyruvate/acetoin dehydrogenase alpha subunit